MMGLEHWDPIRKKFVLYADPMQHSVDCDRFPFESMPKRIFLDTSIVNILVKHGDNVFDRTPVPEGIVPTLGHDIEALMHVFYVGTRANWDLLISQKTIDELSDTKNCDLRQELQDYASLIFPHNIEDEDRRFASNFGRKLVGTPFVTVLPDIADQELIGNAIGYQCDTFCTSDRSTIIKKRDRIRQIPLRILTPLEWWAHVKPWAGLWS